MSESRASVIPPSSLISTSRFWGEEQVIVPVSTPKTNKNRQNRQKPGNQKTWKPRSHFHETSHVYIFKKSKKPTETLET